MAVIYGPGISARAQTLLDGNPYATFPRGSKKTRTRIPWNRRSNPPRCQSTRPHSQVQAKKRYSESVDWAGTGTGGKARNPYNNFPLYQDPIRGEIYRSV